jgi:PAS domain-containing protein
MMLLFPSISGRTMLRALLPYILASLAVLAVLAGYFHFTSKAVETIEDGEREQSILVARSMVNALLDRDLASQIFQRGEQDGIEYLCLRPPYLDLFSFAEFQLVAMPDGYASHTFFPEDSLARSAMITMEPVSRYLEMGKEDNLLLLYPIDDLAGEPAVARIVFENVQGGESFISNRYSVFLIAAAVILLMILPGVFLKLAEIRGKIERTGFYQTDSELKREKAVEIIRSDICPSSLLEGLEFPAVFRLDENGSIMYMNRSAEELTDLVREDMNGALFHELPCFDELERGILVYPESESPAEFSLDVMTSSGSRRRASFRMEKLGRTGFGVSARYDDAGKAVYSGLQASHDIEASSGTAAGGPGHDTVSRIVALLHEGRVRFRNEEAVVEHLGRIHDLLARSESRTRSGEEDTSDTIEMFSELEGISSALNDVLPDRASIELDVPGFLPEVECTRQDFTQLVKNIVFYSLENNSGPVRIKIGAREVPSPVSDSVFSANCDRTVSRSVSLSYSDGTRIPVVLKEALMDPETDLAGIRRDFGSHISSVAAVLSRLDSHPVFTESAMGSTLHILFRISESYLFDQSQSEELHTLDLSSLKLAVCDASRPVRESVSDALALFGIEVVNSPDLDEMRQMLSEKGADYLVLDRSAVLEPLEEALEDIGRGFPGLRIILTGGLPDIEAPVPDAMERKLRVLEKPYSVDDILSIVELTMPRPASNDTVIDLAGRDS